MTSPAGDVLYPDVVVVHRDVPGYATWVEAPVVVVEVLSKSTAERDHGPKRRASQRVPSLNRYVLVGQSQPTLEVATRADDGSGRSDLHEGLEARLRLDALDIEIFARVGFASRAGERPAGQVEA